MLPTIPITWTFRAVARGTQARAIGIKVWNRPAGSQITGEGTETVILTWKPHEAQASAEGLGLTIEARDFTTCEAKAPQRESCRVFAPESHEAMKPYATTAANVPWDIALGAAGDALARLGQTQTFTSVATGTLPSVGTATSAAGGLGGGILTGLSTGINLGTGGTNISIGGVSLTQCMTKPNIISIVFCFIKI